MKKTICLVTFTFLLLTSFSQQVQIEWQQCYGGTDRETGSDIIVRADGHLVILANTKSSDGDVGTNHGDFDFWLFETDAFGNLLWEKTFGGSGSDESKSLAQTHDGGYLLFGQTYSNDGDVTGHHGGYDYWVIKTDSIGNLLWQRSIGSSVFDVANEIELDDEGNIYIIGASWGQDGDVTHNNGAYDYWFLKLNPNGEIIWDKNLGSTFVDVGITISNTSDGGIIVGGLTDNIDGDITCNLELGNPTAWIVKLDSLNNIQWQQCYGGSYTESLVDLECTSDGGYILLGLTNSNDGDVSGFHGYPGDENKADIWVVKVDSMGVMEWQRCLGGTKDETPSFIKITPEGNYLMGGTASSNDGDVSGNISIDGGSDHWIVKLDITGEIIWQKCFGGHWADVLKGAFVISESEFILVGNHSTYSTGGNIDCENMGGDTDLWMYKIIDTTVDIDETVSISPTVVVYPNPAKTYVNFEIQNQNSNNHIISVTVNNIFGQVVETITTKKDQVSNNTKLVWDTHDEKNGIYLYTLITNRFTKSGKIIIDK